MACDASFMVLVSLAYELPSVLIFKEVDHENTTCSDFNPTMYLTKTFVINLLLILI